MPCPHCGTTEFKNPKQHFNHLIGQHGHLTNLKCPLCPDSNNTYRAFDLAEHSLRAHLDKENKYVLLKCPLIALGRRDPINVENQGVCQWPSYQQNKMIDHLQKKHFQNADDAAEIIKEIKNPNGPGQQLLALHKCRALDGCEKSFTNLIDRARHEEGAHFAFWHNKLRFDNEPRINEMQVCPIMYSSILQFKNLGKKGEMGNEQKALASNYTYQKMKFATVKLIRMSLKKPAGKKCDVMVGNALLEIIPAKKVCYFCLTQISSSNLALAWTSKPRYFMLVFKKQPTDS